MGGLTKRPRTDRGIVFAPDALNEMAAGFDELASLLAITLGPSQGAVLHTLDNRIEILSSSGLAARRMTELPHRARNTGAMFARHLAWRAHERFGDGAATATVLARAMIRSAMKQMAAGADPVMLRAGMDRATETAIEHLARQAQPVEGADSLSRMALSVTGDRELAEVLGEMFDILGKDAFIHIEEYTSAGIDREYVEGGYWRGRAAAREMVPAGLKEIMLASPLVMVSGQRIEAVEDLLPVLHLVAAHPGKPPLLMIAPGFGGRAMETINLNNAQGRTSIHAMSLRGTGNVQFDILHDVALMTGAEVLSETRGRSPRQVTAESLGRARSAGFGRDGLTILEGSGDTGLIQQRVSDLRSMLARLDPGDEQWPVLRERLATFEGGIGKLKLGAITKRERDEQRERAQRAIRVISSLMESGLIPGGGTSLLDAAEHLKMEVTTWPDDDVRLGALVVSGALTAPFLQLARNHGRVEPQVALADAIRHGSGWGLDVISGSMVQMVDAGIQDSLGVIQGALRLATSAATSLLLSDVLILPEGDKREVMVDP